MASRGGGQSAAISFIKKKISWPGLKHHRARSQGQIRKKRQFRKASDFFLQEGGWGGGSFSEEARRMKKGYAVPGESTASCLLPPKKECHYFTRPRYWRSRQKKVSS